MRFQKTILMTAAICAASSISRADLVFPPVGGSYGQTIKLIVAASSSSRCSALAKLSNGELLPAAPEQSFDLAPKQVGVLTFNLNKLADKSGQRVDVLPNVQVRGGTCRAAIAIIDNTTGRTTTSFLGRVSEVMKEDQAAAPVAAAVGQIIRLGVARGFDPQPEPPRCAATLGFEDRRGNPVGDRRTVNLAPGGMAFVDLNPGLLLPASGDPHERIAQPRLLLPASGGDLRGCRISVQVYDAVTGWTDASF
jgi:hypothetical protein